MGWIPCPAPKCQNPLSPTQLMISSAPSDLVAFETTYLSKQLVRLPEWCPCTKTKGCNGGVLVNQHNEDKRVRGTGCAVKIVAKRKADAADGNDELQQMIKERKIRSCPVC